jgi:hypothetical protein
MQEQSGRDRIEESVGKWQPLRRSLNPGNAIRASPARCANQHPPITVESDYGHSRVGAT